MNIVNGLVSVIVPCYNQAKFLSEALNSVLIQTYVNWECFVINDGSNDNTEAIALEWGKKDARFKYIKINHGGPSVSRNAALKVATGEYLQFLDSDDSINPEKFSIQIDVLKGTPEYALSICDYGKSVENDLSIPHPSRYLTPRFQTENPLFELISDWQSKLSIPFHCFLLKRQLILDKNIFLNESLPNHVDWDFWMNVFKAKPVVVYVDLKLATYRIHESGITGKKQLMQKGYLKAIEIQKGNFNRNETEYVLLARKFNQIKYGVSTKYQIPAIVLGRMKKIYKNGLSKI